MFRAICNSDICHTIGNVTYIMTEYIRDLFPKNFFMVLDFAGDSTIIK